MAALAGCRITSSASLPRMRLAAVARFGEDATDETPRDGDAALIAATLSGDAAAFGTVVERYERAVYHLCLRTMRDPEDARDATQEAFLKGFRSLHTFRPDAKFSTWIFTIAYHACCDRLARNKRYSNDEIPDYADASPGPETLSIARDESRALLAAIDALPLKYRSVISLYHLQGKQYEEIARVLDLPIGTVKTHIFRAKELLRKRLSDLRDETPEESS